MLIALWPQIPSATPDAPIYVRYGKALFTCGIIVAIILVLLRFTSEHGWWTGHLRNFW